MAQGTKTAEEMPKVKDAKEMPRPRRGRRGLDLSAFIEKLQDNEPHTLELPAPSGDDDEDKIRERWSRRLRAAGKQAGVEVETAFVAEENALYFRGWKPGEAPARGRRSNGTRDGGSKTTATKGKTTKAA